MIALGLAAVLWPVHAVSQSLWAENATAVTADRRARAVGDIITILVQESNTASKDNTTATAKKTGLAANVNTFLYSPAASGFLTKKGQMPAINMDSSSSFSGGGKVNNSEKIAARIAVRVVDVLPNGNLVLEGTKKISFAGETQDAVLRGTVRQEDVSSSSTVYSYNVADATIKYISSGTLANSQRKGWFTKLWEFASPF